jgi:hypothetical protein
MENGCNCSTKTTVFRCTALLGLIKDRHGALWIQSRCGHLKVEAAELKKWRRNEIPAVMKFDLLDGVYTQKPFVIQPVMSLAPDGIVVLKWKNNRLN